MLSKPDQTISKEAFTREAEHIPDDLRTRIQEPLRSHVFADDKILERDHSFFDVHAHSFSIDHIPRDFIKLLNWVSNSDKASLTELIRPTFGKYLGLRNPEKVIENLVSVYDCAFAEKAIKPKLFIVNLTMDMERGISGSPVFNYRDQLEQFLKILGKESPLLSTGRKYSYVKTILPFLAIDPNNPKAYEYFLSAFRKDYNETGITDLDDQAPFLGLKLYPSLGYSPLDPVLLDIYKVCEKKFIPITTHCGGLRTRTNKRKIEIGQRRFIDGVEVDTKKVINISSKLKAKAAFLDPLHWDKVARMFPKLKLNLAHFGSGKDWLGYHKNPEDPKNFIFKTLKMIRQHENVYADISYAYFEEKNQVKIAALMKEERYRGKVLYGSDFYLTEVEKIRTRDLLVQFEKNFLDNPEGYHQLTCLNPYRFLFHKV